MMMKLLFWVLFWFLVAVGLIAALDNFLFQPFPGWIIGACCLASLTVLISSVFRSASK